MGHTHGAPGADEAIIRAQHPQEVGREALGRGGDLEQRRLLVERCRLQLDEPSLEAVEDVRHLGR